MNAKIKIGGYHLQKNARTEEHIKALRECGIDFIIGMNKDTDALDLFEKYGLGAVVEGVVPGWWGGHGDNAGTLSSVNPLEKYTERSQTYTDHPAIIGLCTGDEPSALDFPHYGKVIPLVKSLFPGKFPYLNLYADYGVTADAKVSLLQQFGVPTYEEYIRRYVEEVPTDYISFDHYPYSATPEGYIRNLKTVSDACRSSGREMWVIAQVNSSDAEVWISENKLRYQAFVAMAFGVARLTWACYSAGWWHNQVLDKDGCPTEQYEKLKKVNGEIRAIDEHYCNYTLISTRTTDGETISIEDFGSIGGTSPLVIGKMMGEDGAALMICPTGDPLDTGAEPCKISFRTEREDVAIYGGDYVIPYIKRVNGTYEFTLPQSHGALITVR